MNTVPGEVTNKEEHTEVVHAGDGKAEDGLVEMGAVSETKGGPWGVKGDVGLGLSWT